jgi:N-acyl-L-homoserine lactone synthetase
MIEAFSLKTAHYFGDALASQARLRHRVFVERRGLAHSFYDGMEYDEFDTPAAIYLVWRDQQSVVRGLMRVSPTSMPYMLKSYWPFLCQTRELPESADIWEVTRVCVDRTFDPDERKRIFPKLLCALQELFLTHGVKAMIGVTRPALLNHFLRQGVRWLGEMAEIEGEMESAFWVPTEYLRPEAYCRAYGIGPRVLTLEPLVPRIAA